MPIPIPDAAQRRPLRREDFRDWTTYYWTYQYQLVEGYLIPWLRTWGAWTDDVRVLDVGCGDGGASVALAENGAHVEGFDLEPRRVTMGAERAKARGLDLRLGVADVTDPSTLGDYDGPYDLILFRDVLEHIPDVDAALLQSVSRPAGRSS